MNRIRPCFAYFALIIGLCQTGQIAAQGLNLGIPPIRNFTRKAYNAGTQNWDAAQDDRGRMYWANNEGLLRYDGAHWTLLPVSNHTVVRAVAAAPDGRIFVGAQSELGYFLPEKNGALRYHSLVGLLPPPLRAFEDVWDIVFWHDEVFFRTNRVVFQYTGGKMLAHEPGGALTALFATPAGLLLQEGYGQLLLYRDGRFQPFAECTDLQSACTAALPWTGDTVLFSSLKNGLFYLSANRLARWPTPLDAGLREKRIYSAASLGNGQIALGTSLDGLIVLDRSRRVFRHLTKKSGLQNNNILHTFADRAGNLWLGLDNGIDYVALTAPLNRVIPDGDLQGTGYAAAVFQDNLYLGVSNGVYKAPWKPFYDADREPIFQKIASSDGQVWSLNGIDGELLMGHHEGAFRLSDGAIRRISPEAGAWAFVPLSPEYLLGGTYNGLVLYRKTARGWA